VVVVALGVVALVLWIVVAGLLSGLSSATVLIVGVVTGLFILLFLMKDWRLALRLHPLVVMLVTTAGTLLFGILGATLAAPVTAVALRTVHLLRDTGLFAQRTPASGRSKATA
jgi:putative heme transporter